MINKNNKMPKLNNLSICADSFELLPELPDKCVDLVVTDPPYNLSHEKIVWLHSQFIRICKKQVIVFAPPENQWIHPADQYLFWIKPISTKNTSKHYSRFVEVIFIYGDGIWNSSRHWSQYTNVFTDLVDDNGLHPCRKPPSLIERLLKNHANEGSIILDPFAGSFVVQNVASKLLMSSV